MAKEYAICLITAELGPSDDPRPGTVLAVADDDLHVLLISSAMDLYDSRVSFLIEKEDSPEFAATHLRKTSYVLPDVVCIKREDAKIIGYLTGDLARLFERWFNGESNNPPASRRRLRCKWRNETFVYDSENRPHLLGRR